MWLLDRVVKGDDGEHGIELVAFELLKRGAQALGLNQRRSGVDTATALKVDTARSVACEDLLDHVERGRLVVCIFSGAHERDLRTELASDLSDLVVVR